MSAGEWYKGSLHSHTTNSDGDASPIDVVMWYRDHGYDWLVISDHNKLTRVDTTPLESNSEKFLTILICYVIMLTIHKVNNYHIR